MSIEDLIKGINNNSSDENNKENFYIIKRYY